MAEQKKRSQSVIQGTFNKLYDLIQGTQEPNLFEQPDNTPRSLAQAIKEVLNIDYDGQRRSNVLAGDSSASQRGQQGSTGDAATGERIENGERTADSAGGIEAEDGGSENKGHLAERQGDLGTSVETSNNEFDEDGLPFVISSTGTTIFGEIKEETGLTPAPIKLSLGNSKYGLVHLERRHGEQIRNAGFNSVEEFVEYVCKNYKRIRQGENGVGEENGTYLLQIEDNHNNTLYVELSTDGSYWGVNSGGVFRKEYGNNKKEVWSASEVQNEQSATDSTLRDEDKSDNPTTPNGNVPPTSEDKGTTISPTTNELGEKSAVPSVQEQVQAAEGTAEEARVAEAIRTRFQELEAETGVALVLHESIDDVLNGRARRRIADGDRVRAWYGHDSRSVHIYLPNIGSVAEAEEVFAHEAIAHKGLRKMLGEEAYKTLCLNVYSRLMDEDARAAFLDYIGYEATDAEGNPVAPTEAQMAEAADEYIAHMAERIDTASQTWWEKFVDLVRKALAKRGLLSRADHNALASLLRQSYADLHKAANAEEASQSMAEGGKGETGSKANDVRGDSYEGDFFSDERSVRDIPQLDPGLKKGKEYSIDKVKEIYDRYSSDTEQQALAERVFKVAGTLGIKVDFLREDLGFGIGGKVDGDRMHIARITTLETNKGRTADILLHETIHSVTVTAIDAYRNGDLKNPKLIEAVEEILDVYENVKNDKTLQGEYGLKNAKEMIAEIANPGFRNKLKKLDLWDRLKAASI